MADKYLIVVDMQNDFVTGALGTEQAQAVAANVIRKVRDFPGKVLFTQDTHAENYLDTQEGKLLPVKHCIKGSQGWQIIPELAALQAQAGSPIFEKNTFGSLDLAQYLLGEYQRQAIESVELVGVCTDICVISNALLIKAHMPELQVYVDASCCAGVTPEAHDAALATMRSCQILQR
jgi:nicotinamidase-related amidase